MKPFLFLKLVILSFNVDPRVEQYPLLGSPIPIIVVMGSYVYFVKNLGPRLMQNRKPFELNNVMMIYNLIQVIANVVLGSTVSQFTNLTMTVYFTQFFFHIHRS